MRVQLAAILLLPSLLLSACGRRPPAMPYVTVGVYADRCGYDYNGAAIDIRSLRAAAAEWPRGFEAALLFRFEPVPKVCVDRARLALKAARFGHVWEIVTTRPGVGDAPIMP